MNEKYNIIYADPPWKYERSKVEGSAEDHYPVMEIEDICNLPIADITDKDAVLFLWATFPKLPEALRVIDAWGFKYKSVGFVWIKKNRKADSFYFGLGFWTRGNAEICLLATKGHPHRKSAFVHQLIVSPIEYHSKKPDIARDKIVELLGDLPRIELFARDKTSGWDVWGNEIDSDISLGVDAENMEGRCDYV
jgi:N6-adenosine-specific RNA methylase IME4